MLKAHIVWKEGLSFDVKIREHSQFMDASVEHGGQDQGPNPKELLLASLCGCTGMDVASLLKKFRVTYNHFEVSAESELTQDHPKVFTEIHVYFNLKGENIDQTKFEKVTELSMTRYCGVSAMLSQAAPIYYHLILNDKEVKKARAQFNDYKPHID